MFKTLLQNNVVNTFDSETDYAPLLFSKLTKLTYKLLLRFSFLIILFPFTLGLVDSLFFTFNPFPVSAVILSARAVVFLTFSGRPLRQKCLPAFAIVRSLRMRRVLNRTPEN